MLFYAIIFIIFGFVIGKFINEKKIAIGEILGLSLLWGVSHGLIWGFVTLGEVLLGYVLIGYATKNESND